MAKKKKVIRNSLFRFISSKKYTVFFLFLAVLLSGFFALYQSDVAPPCINADEAAHGYNAYSIMQTGADEYGAFLPARFMSFGEYKFPIYSYFSIPFIAVFGLNDDGVRALNIFLAILFPLVMYLFVKELFEKDAIGVIAAILVSTSLGLGIVTRHAHEVFPATFFIVFASFFFLKFLKKESYKYALLFVLSITIALFSYQFSRLFALFFFCFAVGYFLYKKSTNSGRKLFLILFVLSLSFFAYTDIVNKPARVESLFLTNTPGFSMRIDEILGEGGNRILYNKVTVGVRDVLYNYASFYSPQFLAINGDSNYRFGFPSMAPMTLLEYVFIFIGIYYLFKHNERWRYFLLALFFIAPIPAALSWGGLSLTRGLMVLVIGLILASYGIYHLALKFKGKKVLPYILSFVVVAQSLLLYYSWDFYLNHYPKRALIIRSWQCGYKELGQYIKSNYSSTEKFYITRKHGQPYIYLLFYLEYPPEKYQKEAELTQLDEYGFGQVNSFDKFEFGIPADSFTRRNISIIGYPDDFEQVQGIDTNNVKKIIIGTEEIFWIYETKK